MRWSGTWDGHLGFINRDKLALTYYDGGTTPEPTYLEDGSPEPGGMNDQIDAAISAANGILATLMADDEEGHYRVHMGSNPQIDYHFDEHFLGDEEITDLVFVSVGRLAVTE